MEGQNYQALKIMSIKMEHLIFLDVSSFPYALRKLPEEFCLQSTKSWYPHYFNMQETSNM
jgi:hypothetical protein